MPDGKRDPGSDGHGRDRAGEGTVQSRDDDSSTLTFHIGGDEIILRRRYEIVSIGNDFLIALWFTIGSVLFFWESTATAGTWLFLLGSVQLMARPSIRLTRRVHIQRAHGGSAGTSDAAYDY